MSKKGSKKQISSYEKGIKKILEKSDGFEWIIASYLVDTHDKFKSNVFPTTQVAKIVIDKLDKERTKFAVIHRIVREIFKNYEEEGLCEKLERGRSKKTKKIYKFTEYGFKVLKSKIINFNIENIKGTIPAEFEVNTRSREDMLMHYLQSMVDQFDDYVMDEDFD